MSRIWLDQNKLEYWICEYCEVNGHDPELTDLIQSSWHAENYCSCIYDDPAVRNKITTPRDARWYMNRTRKDIRWINELAKKVNPDE